ncbi:hypothetical protein GCM10022403_001320 [Streptomyces coacervatus]|uniref:Uncharacterized protein n=1 Tax=Streptomyces coacervatus TaxID=647381 RepID=A0ABP7GQP4_9ACTN|nr:hypothetical protein [Streptomyces coacervatus]MDF2264616.1 hypothetical protein [Streptomyces coacervatus]
MNGEKAQVDARELFEALRDHTGPDVFATVVEPWLGRAAGGYRQELVEGVGRLGEYAVAGSDEQCVELLWELYALSRVSDVLLLAFQPRTDEDEPWAATVTMAQYLELFTRLGMTPFEESPVFDPFLHEIVEVEQAEDPDEPIRVTEVVWPGLWFGHLLFGRAGVRVRAGVRHAERGVADRAPLYWTYRRRHRPTVDESMGWGSNSQWRTGFRVDLRTADGYELNVFGGGDIDDTEGFTDASLTPRERRELLRHRCLLRRPVHVALLAATPRWQEDLYPFRGHLRIPTA